MFQTGSKGRLWKRGILILACVLAAGVRGLGVGPGPARADMIGGPPPESRSSDLGPESRPTPLEQLSLKINLPATRLDLYVNGRLDRSYSVAIGMPKYPTPIRDYNISHIVWNPWWIPPDSDWAEGAEKTPPGPGNPLGAVKMLMEDGIRIHGTNAPRSVGRAASHACLRMKADDIKELAWRIQMAYSEKRDPELLDKYSKNRRSSFWVTLFEGVPVSVEYRQVERQGDKFLIHPDRYGRGGLEAELEAALAAHPQVTISKDLVKKLRKLRAKGTVEASLEELTQWSLGEPAPSPESAPTKRS
ncbi:L,D-transpeptidase [Deltaproteobacteria bacterium PRO3]|nr:L,D-transpeptidase [Deltaproteobacteria bacterium PRO3]